MPPGGAPALQSPCARPPTLLPSSTPTAMCLAMAAEPTACMAAQVTLASSTPTHSSLPAYVPLSSSSSAPSSFSCSSSSSPPASSSATSAHSLVPLPLTCIYLLPIFSPISSSSLALALSKAHPHQRNAGHIGTDAGRGRDSKGGERGWGAVCPLDKLYTQK